MRSNKIAISGELGSGKTALGKLLSERLSYSFISVGSIQRELAEKLGMTTIEFNKYMESHPEFDKECDRKVEEYGLSDSDLILDSRLAWHFVPHAFKIHLVVNINIAAKRIFHDSIRKNENNNDLNHAIENIIIRKESERKRFMDQYCLNIDDFNNYTIVIDTSYITPESLADFVIDKFRRWKSNDSFPSLWLSPRNILPLQSIREHSYKYSEQTKNSILKEGFFEAEAINVIRLNDNYFIFDGHKRCSVALQLGIDLIPVSIVNSQSNYLADGQSTNDYVRDNYNLTNIYDWEEMHNFRFVNYFNN